jgi:DNA polymerase-3 subunit beta
MKMRKMTTVTAKPMSDSAKVARALRQVAAVTSDDPTRPYLAGVLFEGLPDGLRLVATDAYRIMIRELPEVHALEPGERVVLPAQTVRDLAERVKNAKTVTISFDDETGDARIDVDGHPAYASTLDAARFPEWQQIVDRTDSHPTRMTVNRLEVLGALNRVRTPRLPAIRQEVKFVFTDEGLVVTGNKHDGEHVPAALTGPEADVLVNLEFVRTGFDAAGMRAAQVTVEAAGPRLPLVIRGESFTYLVMPIWRRR